MRVAATEKMHDKFTELLRTNLQSKPYFIDMVFSARFNCIPGKL